MPWHAEVVAHVFKWHGVGFPPIMQDFALIMLTLKLAFVIALGQQVWSSVLPSAEDCHGPTTSALIGKNNDVHVEVTSCNSPTSLENRELVVRDNVCGAPCEHYSRLVRPQRLTLFVHRYHVLFSAHWRWTQSE